MLKAGAITVPSGPTASSRAPTTASAPTSTGPTARIELCTISASPGLTPRSSRSSTIRPWVQPGATDLFMTCSYCTHFAVAHKPAHLSFRALVRDCRDFAGLSDCGSPSFRSEVRAEESALLVSACAHKRLKQVPRNGGSG